MPVIDGNEAQERKFDKGTWKLTVNRYHWACESPRFGKVEYAIITNENGTPLFDRPRYFEASHIITVVWGEKDGAVHVGLVLEARPHAFPKSFGGRDQKFWGVPRGFLNSGETPAEAARREAGEESGTTVVLETRNAGDLNPNPTFCATYGPVVFLKVDLERLETIRPSRGEKIYKAKFFPLDEIKRMIVAGKYDGGLLEDGVSLAALAKFFAHLEP